MTDKQFLDLLDILFPLVQIFAVIGLLWSFRGVSMMADDGLRKQCNGLDFTMQQILLEEVKINKAQENIKKLEDAERMGTISKDESTSAMIEEMRALAEAFGSVRGLRMAFRAWTDPGKAMKQLKAESKARILARKKEDKQNG